LKRNSILVISLALFSLLAGYLLAGISFIGKAGISIVYTQYQFLKSWWKGALLVFLIWVIIFIIQSLLLKRISKTASNIIVAISLLLAFTGLYFSYADFNNTLSHRWLGQRFHLGVYLFWLGWIALTVFLFFIRKSLDSSRAKGGSLDVEKRQYKI